MSSGVFKGNSSGTGVVTLETPNTNSDITIALPARAGNLMMDGPAFSAYQSSAQTISNATFTKIQFQTELWDTNNNYDNTTNYRFTPTVAGYYQINAAVQMNTAIAGLNVLAIYKNNNVFLRSILQNSNSVYGSTINGLVYANGTTDYFEIFFYQARGSSQDTDAGTSAYTWFQAALVRGA